MPNMRYEWGGGQPPLKRVQDHFSVSKCCPPPIPAMWSQVPAWVSVFLLVKADRPSFPREKIQITETSDQPSCAHTKLLLLIQHGMLQILYSMNIYSLQKWLPNH